MYPSLKRPRVRRSRLGLAVALLAAAGALGACVGGTGSTGPTLGVDIGGTKAVAVQRQQALAEINALRRQNGLGALSYNSDLDEVADRQARAMAARGGLAHGLDGRLTERATAFGYDWATVAENIGWNYGSTSAVMDGWEGSPGHRKNMLNPNVRELGMGAAVGSSGEPYWAMILGRRKGQP